MSIDFNKQYVINKLLSIKPLEYKNTLPYPHIVLENALDENFAKKCQNEILNIKSDMWDRYNNPFEQKYTLRDKDNFPINCKELFNQLMSQDILDILSNIVGEKLYNDLNKTWWGIHIYENGDYLDIHSDAGNHPINKMKKHITIGIYLSNNWNEINKGHLEIWDGDNVLDENPKLNKCVNKILPSFNKMVIFSNTCNAWHGNPEPVNILDDERRIFVTISYLSNQHSNGFENNREKAYFISRPDDPINIEKDKLRLLRADPNQCKKIYNIQQ